MAPAADLGFGPLAGSRPDGLAALGCLLAGQPSGEATPWELVVPLAVRHSLGPLLYWRATQEPGGAALPAPLLEELRNDFYCAAARTMLAEGQLAELLAALDEAKVPALVLKGAATGAFYPDPGLRAYTDLDFLVRDEQVGRAETVLRDLGYVPHPSPSWWQDHFQHLPPMARPDGGLSVEVHWRTGPREGVGCLPVHDLWARGVSWSLGPGTAQPALRLDDVDTALHLCQHAAIQHRLRVGLRPLCDLAQVVAGWDRGRWLTLSSRARAYGLDRAVDLVLALADRWLSLDPPPDIARAWQPLAPLLDAWLARLAYPEAGAPAAMIVAGSTTGHGARLRHLLRHLFLPRQGMALLYGIPARSPLIWLAYARRPIDLLRKHGEAMWHVLRGKEAARAAWNSEVWLERWLHGPDGANRGESPPGGQDRSAAGQGAD
ncbi:MAG: nucleotidyltransferase family protein [Anaerolineae bacterium]|jgi:hypothetical protein|nr:nucleotidyltransferase family protein [Anaerolineae bacterium]